MFLNTSRTKLHRWTCFCILKSLCNNVTLRGKYYNEIKLVVWVLKSRSSSFDLLIFPFYIMSTIGQSEVHAPTKNSAGVNVGLRWPESEDCHWNLIITTEQNICNVKQKNNKTLVLKFFLILNVASKHHKIWFFKSKSFTEKIVCGYIVLIL